MEKSEVRKNLLRIRNGIASKSEKSALIKNAVLPLIEQFDVIGIFVSMENEVDTVPIIETLLKKGKTVAVPLINGENLDFYKINALQELVETGARYKIREPLPNVEKFVSPKQIQVMVCPGVGFDKDFNRLGYGKGYYDRYIGNISVCKIGICFNDQLIESIPTEKYDIKMDYIVTETTCIKNNSAN